jgi:spore germination protein KC
VDISRIKKPHIALKKDGDRMRAQVTIYALGEVVTVASNHKYELPSRIPVLEKAVKKWMTQYCRAAFRKAQKNGADIFGFGNYAHWMVPDWKAWQEWDWDSTFKNMTLDLKVKTHIERTGLIMEKNAAPEEG